MKFILLIPLLLLLSRCVSDLVVDYSIQDELDALEQIEAPIPVPSMRVLGGIENEQLEYLDVIPIELNLQKDSTVPELIEGRKPLLDKTIVNYHLAYGLSSRMH